jgi:hypothetical protein
VRQQGVLLHGGRRLQQDVDEVIGLALHEHVHEGLEGIRIGEGERPTGHHEGVALVPLLLEDGDAGQVQHGEQAGQLQLVGHGEGQHVEAGDGGLRLEGEEGRAGAAVRLHVIGQEGALGGGSRVGVNLPVHGLVAERAHAYVVGARIAEGHPVGGLLAERPLLIGQQRRDTFNQ